MQRNQSSYLIRQKADFLPDTFISREFDTQFLAALTSGFESLLSRYYAKGTVHSFQETITKHGLLEINVPLELILGRIELEIQTSGGIETRVFERSEPISCGFRNIRFKIEWSRIGDDNYRSETASVLAYMLAWRKLAKEAKSHELIVIATIDAIALDKYLRTKHRGQVSAHSLSEFLLERIVNDEINRLSLFDMRKK